MRFIRLRNLEIKCYEAYHAYNLAHKKSSRAMTALLRERKRLEKLYPGQVPSTFALLEDYWRARTPAKSRMSPPRPSPSRKR